MAADLALQGHEVLLYELEDFRAGLAPVVASGEIVLLENDAATPARVCVVDSLAAALAQATIVNVVVPSTGHDRFFEAMLPHLRSDHVVVVWSGRLGALRLARMAELAQAENFKIVEINTLPFGARVEGEGRVRVLFRARKLYMAAFPGSGNSEIIDQLTSLYPTISPVLHVAGAALLNSSLLVLPTGTILNAGCIDRAAGEFYLFRDGIGPGVGNVIGAVNREFAGIGAALGIEVPIYADEVLSGLGSVEAANFIAHDPAGYAAMRGPAGLNHRYLLENIPYGFAPIAELGGAIGMRCPVVEGLVAIAEALLAEAMPAERRTMVSLGLADRTKEQILNYLLEGRL